MQRKGTRGEQKEMEEKEDESRENNRRRKSKKGGRVKRSKNVRCIQKEAWRKLQEMAYTEIRKKVTQYDSNRK